MLGKIPIVATPITAGDLTNTFRLWARHADAKKEFAFALAEYIQAQRIFFSNSGTSSAFMILDALKKISDKKEVILPAYTASALMIAIQKAGLTPVLCDIALDDFNMDVRRLQNAVSPKTLCIFGVHMFGIISRVLKEAKHVFPSVFVIEDCAQGLGSRIDEKSVGNLADASIFSFNRGKNLPTYGGGCAATSHAGLIKLFEDELKNIPRENGIAYLSLPLKITALSVAIRPFIYGLLSFFISQFKEQSPRADFNVKEYTSFQAAVALSVLRRLDEYSQKRYLNGMRLREGLKAIDGIMVPEILENTKPAFNRFPLVFKDLKRRDAVKKKLMSAGIDSSLMYMQPLHHIFDAGYKKDDFPNAGYFAGHLLTLPVHPLVKETDIGRMIEIIRCSP
jgi:dTDP-4-amino-4,6-dideoxygalactose transaminase